MKSSRKRISLVLALLMMFSLVPAAYADEAKAEARNLARDAVYMWSEAPESAYPDPGNKLNDGVFGTRNVLDPAWVGHLRKKTREVVFDLGEPKSISGIKAHFLQDWPGSAVLFPLTVSMYVSDDNVHWATLTHKATQTLWIDGPPVDETYAWDAGADGVPGAEDATHAYARYVKVTFTMHTRAWTFIDEIEITGTDGQSKGAVRVPPEEFKMLAPGEATAGIRDLSLLYNGHYANGDGDWSKEDIIPQISYVNQDGEPVDWFFDGVLVLGLLSPDGRDFGGGSNLKDWNWYLDKTFAADGDMFQLNEATKEAGTKLGDPDHKTKVVVMIPDPSEYVTDFGDVDGDGKSENFNAGSVGEQQAMANRQKAVRWWMDEVLKRWESSGYSHLELAGLYWLSEQVSTSASGPDMLKYVNGEIHAEGLKSFWIPHFLAYKSYMWKEVGFDAVAFQPNYFFEEMSSERLDDAAYTAERFGMGVEIEFDGRMLTDPVFRQRYKEYLDGGVKYGYMTDTFKAYYKGSGPVLGTAAASEDPEIRIMYDWLYQFVKGTYQLDNTGTVHMKELVNQLEKGGQFKSHGAARSLTAHWDSVVRFEEQGNKEQASGHLDRFLELLEQHKQNGLVSGKAYPLLKANADYVAKRLR
ncbi:DUF4855 domain-containing protein [Paenibacillus lactis]|uniref:FIMAH domain-containing protein n=1 Tax=Paenibacillus lactis TaxID=228574 RepID=A0ABS4FEU5_9BACL|nr:DUF4855 domain-containing protein [Paenibacillus lactis]MBP1894764.1 hypothetical protein [Paenibacillus lactis]HAG00229.1 DUF4855 domain-containing protein [Paenibacillus lactis]